jgi:hypothetical protein
MAGHQHIDFEHFVTTHDHPGGVRNARRAPEEDDAMELLDRYLQAVKKHLPWQRQDDIIAELRANLESQLDEKQEELGRPLTPAEAEAWIGQLGSPVQMASHYQPQQYLIGPAFYPVYLYVLRLAGMWTIIVYMIVSTVTLVLGPSPNGAAIAEAALRLPFILLQTAAWITLAFAAIEYIMVRHPHLCPPIAGVSGIYGKWSPSELPPLEPAAAPGQKRRRYSHAVTEVIFGFIVLIWLLLVPRYPFLMFGPGVSILRASPFRVNPQWITFYWWIVGLNAIQLAWRCTDLIRGTWRNPGRALHIVSKFFGLVPVVVLAALPGHIYVLLRHPEVDQARYGATVEAWNNGIHTGLKVLCVILALQLAWDIAQPLLETWRKRQASK